MFLCVSILSSLLFTSFIQIPSSNDHNLDKPETYCTPAIFPSPMAIGVRYRQKFLKRRLSYGCNHPGSYNPAVITNQEAHMIYGNMDKGHTEKNTTSKSKRSGSTQITNFFSKASNAGKLYINFLISCNF